MNKDEPQELSPETDPICSEEAAAHREAVEVQGRSDRADESQVRADEILERRGRALGSILTLAPDDFAKRYQALFQSALQGG